MVDRVIQTIPKPLPLTHFLPHAGSSGSKQHRVHGDERVVIEAWQALVHRAVKCIPSERRKSIFCARTVQSLRHKLLSHMQVGHLEGEADADCD